MTDVVDIKYSYSSVPTIKAFSRSKAFIRGLRGPFGSGKSSGCVMQLVRIGAAQKPWSDGVRRSRFAAIRNTYRQLEDTTIKTFHAWLPPRFFGKWLKDDHVYLIDRLDEGLEIEVLFRALDRPEHVANLLSLDLTAAWINEAREVPWAVVQATQGRVGRYPPIREARPVDACVMMDTNSPDTDSWWYEFFEEKKPENAEQFVQPSGMSDKAENLPFLPDNYYQNLLQSYDSETANVYVHGNYGFIKDGRPVYADYNDALHCQDIEPIKGVTIYRGWDFGLTPACTFSQVLPDGRWNTFDELTSDSLDIHTFGATVVEHTARAYPWAKSFVDIGDPAGEARSPTARPTEAQSCFDVLHGMGVMVEPGDQTLTLRLGSVNYALRTLRGGKPILCLHSRCKRLRKGYQGRYQYKRVRVSGTSERYHDEPEKNEYSHPHDANQYVAARLFGQHVKGQEQMTSLPPLAYPKVWRA